MCQFCVCVCVWLWRGGRRWMEVCVGARTCEVTFCNYISHQEWWLGVTDAPPCTTLYNLLVPPCTTSTHHLLKPLLLLCSAKNWPQDWTWQSCFPGSRPIEGKTSQTCCWSLLPTTMKATSCNMHKGELPKSPGEKATNDFREGRRLLLVIYASGKKHIT